MCRLNSPRETAFHIYYYFHIFLVFFAAAARACAHFVVFMLEYFGI